MQAIETNSCYIVINKIIERVSVEALDFMDRKDIITIFPTQKRNNTTVVVMKTPKTETSNRKVYIPSHVGKCLKELKAEQDHTKEMNIRIITWCLPRLLVCQLEQAMFVPR